MYNDSIQLYQSTIWAIFHDLTVSQLNLQFFREFSWHTSMKSFQKGVKQIFGVELGIFAFGSAKAKVGLEVFYFLSFAVL